MKPGIIDLGGTWKLRSEGIDMGAQVPGDVHLDLLRTGMIPDPMIGDNVLQCRQWERRTWRYSKEFVAPSDRSKQFRRAELVFEGLDTHARIRLNGRALGETRNAFMAHTFDVTDALKEQNILEVELNDGLALADNFDVAKYTAASSDREQLRRLALRKPQFVFGWDWAPRLISCGIWRPAMLALHRNLALRHVWVKGWHGGHVRLSLAIENFTVGKLDISMVALIDGLEQRIELIASPGLASYDCQVKLPHVKLWYPWDVGEPFCYNINIKLLSDGLLEVERDEIFGLRTIEVVQPKDEEGGTSFTFVVNGKKVFARGGNWVPADLLFLPCERGTLPAIARSGAGAALQYAAGLGGRHIRRSPLLPDVQPERNHGMAGFHVRLRIVPRRQQGVRRGGEGRGRMGRDRVA